jgi:CRISPR-associated exonuclease Cas4
MEPIPLSLLNDFLYCNRRAALKEIEGTRLANAHTVIGDFTHAQADLPGYESSAGVMVLRALPVWSDRLGLSGKCDIVEKHPNRIYVPVEYKKGKRRAFENDDVQLCAQAFCLEDMLGVHIAFGAVFHAASKRRRTIEFTPQLRSLTEETVRLLRDMIDAGNVPRPELKPLCEGCSLKPACIPELANFGKTSLTQLFTTDSHA